MWEVLVSNTISYAKIQEKLERIRKQSEAYLFAALNIKGTDSFPRFDEESKYREEAFYDLKQCVDSKKGKYLIARHQNKKIVQESRSGGIFTALSDVILDTGGIVYGCKMEGVEKAVHVRVETKKDRDFLRGSKYIPSDMNDCFLQVREDLLAGKKVLFSGTGCQVAGLKAFLKDIDQSCLYTLDIICHGTPSVYIWNAYLRWIEDKFNRKITDVDFRDKKFGWSSHYETVNMGKYRFSASIFRNLFYRHYILRPSCYICPFASINRCSDITAGDAWGIQKTSSRLNDNKGCSLIIINNDHGKELVNSITDMIDSEEVCIDDYLQPNLKQPSFRPKDRDQFWTIFETGGFSAVFEKYGKRSKPEVLKEKLCMLYYRFFRS